LARSTNPGCAEVKKQKSIFFFRGFKFFPAWILCRIAHVLKPH
jgi:hypothetical protein